jgi:hypothetical protein
MFEFSGLKGRLRLSVHFSKGEAEETRLPFLAAPFWAHPDSEPPAFTLHPQHTKSPLHFPHIPFGFSLGPYSSVCLLPQTLAVLIKTRNSLGFSFHWKSFPSPMRPHVKTGCRICKNHYSGAKPFFIFQKYWIFLNRINNSRSNSCFSGSRSHVLLKVDGITISTARQC